MIELIVGYVEFVLVFFDDFDVMGVVYNGKYVVFIEWVLAVYWDWQGWMWDLAVFYFVDIFFVVCEFIIIYQVFIIGVGDVGVYFWIDDLGNMSVVYCFWVLLVDGCIVHVEGWCMQVWLDCVIMCLVLIFDVVCVVCQFLFVEFVVV